MERYTVADWTCFVVGLSLFDSLFLVFPAANKITHNRATAKAWSHQDLKTEQFHSVLMELPRSEDLLEDAKLICGNYPCIIQLWTTASSLDSADLFFEGTESRSVQNCGSHWSLLPALHLPLLFNILLLEWKVFYNRAVVFTDSYETSPAISRFLDPRISRARVNVMWPLWCDCRLRSDLRSSGFAFFSCSLCSATGVWMLILTWNMIAHKSAMCCYTLWIARCQS